MHEHDATQAHGYELISSNAVTICVECGYEFSPLPVCPECGRVTQTEDAFALAYRRSRAMSRWRAVWPTLAIYSTLTIVLAIKSALSHYSFLSHFTLSQTVFTSAMLLQLAVGMLAMSTYPESLRRVARRTWLANLWILLLPGATLLPLTIAFALVWPVKPPPQLGLLTVLIFGASWIYATKQFEIRVMRDRSRAGLDPLVRRRFDGMRSFLHLANHGLTLLWSCVCLLLGTVP